MKIELAKSPVVFIEEPHEYHLGEKRLSGITSLIHEVLQLGVYSNARDYVRNVAIPRAGEYGTAVHHSIEAYDKMGIKVTVHPKSERFIGRDGAAYWDVSEELDSYIRHRQGYEPIGNEYTVSDEVRYASNIDNVWLKTDTQGIWLVDTKTNNLERYPGGEDALKEYLSWQLSAYALLFERQNPDLKVEGLACNWLRHKDAAFWVIDRKPDEMVEKLLSVEWKLDGEEFSYYGYDPNDFGMNPHSISAPIAETQVVPMSIARAIYDIERQIKEAEETQKKMRSELRKAMEANGIKSWENGLFKATIALDCEVKTFDASRFKKDHPDLYEQYTKTTSKKGGFTIKLKE